MRAAFTLVELLVVVAIILVLMGIIASAASAARGSSKKQATQMLIAKLDAIIQQQFATYASRGAPVTLLTGPNKSAIRGAYLRQMATGDLPDSWADVKYMAANTPLFTSAPQRSYVALYKSGTAAGKTPTDDYGDAECLFMIVMQGGIANCLDCGELKTAEKGDVDNDGSFEFLDAWGYPIRYVLWPSGLQMPVGSGNPFFSSTPLFAGNSSAATQGRLMRPLIFSCGPDETKNPLVPESPPSLITSGATGNLSSETNCGVPPASTNAAFGAPRIAAGLESPADNITNLDAEAAK